MHYDDTILELIMHEHILLWNNHLIYKLLCVLTKIFTNGLRIFYEQSFNLTYNLLSVMINTIFIMHDFFQ